MSLIGKADVFVANIQWGGMTCNYKVMTLLQRSAPKIVFLDLDRFSLTASTSFMTLCLMLRSSKTASMIMSALAKPL